MNQSSPKHQALRNRLFRGLDHVKINGGADSINSGEDLNQESRNQELAEGKNSDLAPNPKQAKMVKAAGGNMFGEPSHQMDVKGIEQGLNHLHPPMVEGSPEEEASESPAEARAEGDIGGKNAFHKAMMAEHHGTAPGSLRDKVKQHMSKMKY